MCGRFALSIIPARFQRVFGVMPPEGYVARWNIVPDSPIPIVRAAREGGREATFARWGLLGPWMKEANDKGRQINARCETAAEKPMFRDSLAKGRCLVPADGFYEWQKQRSGPSRPFFVTSRSGEPLAFAGLWRRTRLGNGELLESCAILTTAAHPSIAAIHPRMPVILPVAAHDAWLDAGVAAPERLLSLLRSGTDGELAFREVTRRVNDPREDDPGLPLPAADAPAEPTPEPAQASLF
jgi:putative SOS response-associated peptidase YedK